jgi:hypothetical protein
MNENILAKMEESALEAEFAAACENPQGLDCGFEEQRCGTGFANFGFSPDKAAEMREKELARIASELEAETPEYDEEDEDDDLEDEGPANFDDEPFDDEYFEDDDLEDDRFTESYDFEDEDLDDGDEY